ncbi:hypothetical protein [Paracoccus kondratievae]|uniref:Uncharacterized protein n=1 Tax=Paracoccus kondratievae TaxID=135740 RepID=A0AAD3NZ11_9RHOB|nr:hypothetical protein [Paracoccus kondratievae]GLK64189.1 hypothetical protein GCM10017635_16600 [Paracoccus kondratievae]
MKPLQLLHQVQEHLLESRIVDAMKGIRQFEELVLAGKVGGENASGCTEALLTIRALITAVRDGAAAVRYQFDEIMALTRSIYIYDEYGKRTDCCPAVDKGYRF